MCKTKTMFIKNKKFSFIFLLLLTDCITFLLSFLVAFYVRFYILPAEIVYSFSQYFKISLLLIPVWILFVNFFIGYKLAYISKFNLFIKVLKTSIAFVIFILALIFIIKNDTSRLMVFLMWINLIIFTLLLRYILKKIIAYIVYKLNIRNNLLVIGKKVRKYKKIFNNNYINKVFYYPYELNDKNIEKLKTLSLKKQIREIIIINYSVKDEQFLSLCNWAVINNVDIKIIPNETQMAKDKVEFDDTLGIPIILLVSNPVYDFEYFLKRILDIIFSLIMLIVLLPVFLIIAIAIKIESKGPVIFKHLRLGFNEKEFFCYKFRSMSENANENLKILIQNSAEQNEAFLKLEDDDRITKVGKFIRKYSLDELPQLFNVLKGEMSLVGPRPIVRLELEQIKNFYHNYSYGKMFKVLPGITGLWQVSGRSLLSDEKRLELEIYYVDNWSLSFDIKILIKTVFVVLFHKGAY
ncbi:sugar transferase [Candidatus Ruminimicrobium bovinum]|uniref:sugar transferase n=1 Tax=Candidatus Ruminimicrobium bovinum TaxID=3242779 RepID=UPI0039B9A03C